MKDIVNPLILTISTDLKKGGSVIRKSAIVDVKVRKGHLIVAHTTDALSRAQFLSGSDCRLYTYLTSIHERVIETFILF